MFSWPCCQTRLALKPPQMSSTEPCCGKWQDQALLLGRRYAQLCAKSQTMTLHVVALRDEYFV